MWMTVNKVVDGKCVKYDTYETEAEADAMVTELHNLGLTEAYKVDIEKNKSSAGLSPIARPAYVTCDADAKTVTFDNDGIGKELAKEEMDILVRGKRNALLADSDTEVLPDRWASMGGPKQTEWTNYRQALRDMPANTADPKNPTWPDKP